MTEEQEVKVSDKLLLKFHDLVDENETVYGQGHYENYGKENQTFTPRTEWQDGWNAAVEARHDNWWVLIEWWKSLPSKYRKPLEELLMMDEVEVIVLDNKETRLMVNCNDIFAWALAEGEYVELDELEDLLAYCEKTPTWGAIQWVIKKRWERPQYPVEKSMREKGVWFDWMDELPENAEDTYFRKKKAEEVKNG